MIIKWNSGTMEINLEEFFPCNRDQLKLLLKTVDLDKKHQDDHLNEIMQFLKKKEHEMLEQGKSADAQVLYLCQEEMKEIYGGSWE